MRRLPRRRIEVLAAVAVCASVIGVGYATSGSTSDSGWTGYAPLPDATGSPEVAAQGYLIGPGGTPLVCDGKRMMLDDAKHPPKSLDDVEVTAVVARCGENGAVTWVYALRPTL